MPDIKDSVGDGGSNKGHDVALLQAMLKVVSDAKSVAYLQSNYDGSYGAGTKAAIARFQIDQGLADPPQSDQKKVAKTAATTASAPSTAATPGVAKEKLGFVAPNSPTMQKLNAMLPATHKNMCIMTGSKLVYIAADADTATSSKVAISNDDGFEIAFRPKLADLVRQMYQEYKITLWIAPDGRHRTFDEQSALFAKGSNTTKAGPGESNHNFGRAADIGFRGFQWVKGDGQIETDNDWLLKLSAVKSAEGTRLWDKRDDLGRNLGLHRLGFERIHIQSYVETPGMASRSLAALLTSSSTNQIQWKTGYQADLKSGGKYWAHVGNAQSIWKGNASVSASDLAKARTAATGKTFKVTEIKQADVDNMRKALKEDFQSAETNWSNWVGVTKQ